MNENSSAIVYNNNIVINGQKIPPLPNGKDNFSNICIINNRIYVNGYRLKNGKWKRTFLAWFHLYF